MRDMKVAMKVDDGHWFLGVWQIFPVIAMLPVATGSLSPLRFWYPKQPFLGKRVRCLPSFQMVYPHLIVRWGKLPYGDKAAATEGEPETYKHRKKAALFQPAADARSGKLFILPKVVGSEHISISDVCVSVRFLVTCSCVSRSDRHFGVCIEQQVMEDLPISTKCAWISATLVLDEPFRERSRDLESPPLFLGWLVDAISVPETSYPLRSSSTAISTPC